MKQNVILIMATAFLLAACGEKESTPGAQVDVTGTGTFHVITPKKEPWTVVCDKEGHFNFTDDSGYLWPIEEWDTHESAMVNMLRIKRLRETNVTTPEERKRYDEIQGRDWGNCEPRPKASASASVGAAGEANASGNSFKLSTDIALKAPEIAATLTSDYKTLAIGGVAERVTFNGGVAGEWLIVERHNKTAHDAKGFDPSYVSILSDLKPVVTKRTDGKWKIHFETDLP